MSDALRRYAIISPVRNEAAFIRRTLESVVAQTEHPVIWVIVDDGSTDGTADIISEFAEKWPFIRVVPLADNNAGSPDDRLLWAAEAIAFREGLCEVGLDGIDFVVKLDGDLAFGPEYFSALMDEFGRDPSLGMAGGYCYQVRDGRRVLEGNPASHVRGPTKMYRVACYRDIGGIEPVYGWDALDELKAQMRGWTTRSFDYPVDHLKPTGTVGGLLHARVRGGRGAYLLGYHPLFLLARCARLACVRPYGIGGVAFLAGFMAEAAAGSPRVADPATVDYLRHQQLGRLHGPGTISGIRSVLGRGAR